MNKVRIIPCLDVKDGRVVKGINFIDLIDAGDPVEQAKHYSENGADEICFLDISASLENRDTMINVVEKTANDITFTFEQDLKDENIYLELEKIYEEATCESYLQIEAYGKKIFAEETLNKMEELGFEPYLEEVTSKNFNGILFRVMIGPMQSISDTNNARETLIRADFLPLLRTKCVQT